MRYYPRNVSKGWFIMTKESMKERIDRIKYWFSSMFGQKMTVYFFDDTNTITIRKMPMNQKYFKLKIGKKKRTFIVEKDKTYFIGKWRYPIVFYGTEEPTPIDVREKIPDSGTDSQSLRKVIEDNSMQDLFEDSGRNKFEKIMLIVGFVIVGAIVFLLINTFGGT